MNVADIEDMRDRIKDLEARIDMLGEAVGIAVAVMSKKKREAFMRRLAAVQPYPHNRDPRGGSARISRALLASMMSDE